MNKNRITVILSDESMDMMDKIKIKVGHASASEVIRTSLYNYYSKIFKDYIDIKSSAARDPEGAAKRKIEIQNRKEQLEREKEMDDKLEIVKVLEGKIIEKNGIKYCQYYTHDLHKSYLQEISVLNLTEDLPNFQYAPSKALVIKARPKDFKVKK